MRGVWCGVAKGGKEVMSSWGVLVRKLPISSRCGQDW